MRYPARQQDWQQTARQGTKTQGTPGTKKKVSTSSPTGSPSRKPVTTGKAPTACRAREPSPAIFITQRNQQAGHGQPAKPLIYMALRIPVCGTSGDKTRTGRVWKTLQRMIGQT